MPKRKLLIVALCLVTSWLPAQITKIDSLRSMLATDISPEVRVEALRELGLAYIPNSDSTFRYLYESLGLAKEHDLVELIGRNHYDLGQEFYYARLLQKSKQHFDSAFNAYQELQDTIRIAQVAIEVAKVANDQGDFVEAMSKYNLALPILEASNDNTNLSNAYNGLGILYSKQELFNQSLFYTRRAISLLKELGNRRVLGICYNNMGLNFKKMAQYDSAFKYYDLALEIGAELEFYGLVGTIYNNKASVLVLQGENDSGLVLYEKALVELEKVNHVAGIGWAYKGISEAQFKKKNVNAAIKNGLKGYRMGEESGERDLLRQSAEVLAQAYASAGDFENAYQYQALFKQHSDSLLSESKIRELVTLEYQFQTQQNEDIRRLELQAQEHLFSGQIERQKIVRNSMIGGLALVLVAIFFLYRNYRHKKAVNAILEAQNRTISEQADNLRKLNETKDHLFSIISHDLRSPMSTFMGLPYIIKAHLEDKRYDELEQFADHIGAVSSRITQMLDNLLTWAMQQKDHFIIKPEPIGLKSLIDEMVGVFAMLIESKKLQVEINIDEEAQLVVDRNSVMTVFRNLLNNAIKFTPEGGKIVMSHRLDQQHVITMSDSGVGMTTDKLDALFNQSGEVSYGTGGEKGVGLGLQLVKEFVEANNGTISVESVLHEGTTFTVCFPVISS